MKEVKDAHIEFTYSSLKPISISMALLNVMFAASHPFVLEGDQKYILIALCGATALIFFSLWLALIKFDALYKYTIELMILALAIPYFNTFMHMWLYADPLQTSIILMLQVATGVFVMNQRALVGIISISSLVWFLIALHYGFGSEWIHFVFSIIPAFFLLGIANNVIFTNFKNIQEAKDSKQQQNTELKAAKTKLEIQSEELKAIITELEKAKDEVIKASKSKEQFLSAMSHELRTPLNAVIGLTKILFQNNPREDQIDDLETLQFSADNLLSLINDLLDFSKMKAGKIRIEQIEFDLEKLLTKHYKSFENKAKEKNLELNYELQDLPKHTLFGDPVRLTQILNNLIGNALKFTQKGNVTFRVFVKKQSQDELILKFEIEDTGVGISDDQIDAVFDAFSQIDSANQNNLGGTGLGLTITQKLVELMGGEIGVQSEANKGTLFYFTMPFKHNASVQESTVSSSDSSKESNTSESAKKQIKTNSFPKGFKALLVEDNDINIKVISKLLKNEGIQHEIVMDGSSACQLIQNKQYDLVLMDLQMPIMDGFEATKEIRAMQDEYFKNIPIIALTASTPLDVEKEIKEAGMNDCISKPVEMEELRQKMLNVLKTQKTT